MLTNEKSHRSSISSVELHGEKQSQRLKERARARCITATAAPDSCSVSAVFQPDLCIYKVAARAEQGVASGAPVSEALNLLGF